MSSNDSFLLVGIPGTATTLAAPGHTIGGSTFNVVSTNNWPTLTGVAFAVDRINPSLISASNPSGQIPGSYTEWVGDVTSSTSITGAVLSSYSPNSDQNYPAGVTTRVYIPVSATTQNRMATGMANRHNQDGTHKAFTESNIVTTSSIQNVAVTDAKIGGVSATKFSNPYKFSVYRNASQNVGTAATKVQYDTESYDTGNNFDSTTNFRFTAPVAGFYRFDVTYLTTTAGSGTNVAVYLYKNGTQTRTLAFDNAGAGASPGSTGGTDLQLAANDYIEVYMGTATAAKALDVSAAGNNVFSGRLISTT